jgi:nucleoside transporter
MDHQAPRGAISRLSLMMFLQYAVWGLWLPILGRYLQAPVAEGGLGFSTGSVGWIIGLGASVGAVTAPFIAGQFADRYFRADRFLAFLLLTGGVVQIILAQQTTVSGWIIFSILYSILFMPTLSLTNSVTFANLSNTETQFPKVRVFGTLGWIAAAWIFPMVWLQTGLHFQSLPPFIVGTEVEGVTHRLIDAMTFSGGLSILYSLYCLLALPPTPPKKDGVESIAFAKAFALMAKPSVMILVISSLVIAMIHQIYFIQTSQFLADRGLPESYIMPAMSIGQFAEIAVMAILGFMLTRLGFKWVIVLGALAYVARYSIWAVPSTPLWLVVSSQALHGFCYACFFAGTYIYIDRVSPRDVRNSAQTVIGIVILGLGPVLASVALPFILSMTASDPTANPPVINYQGLWGTLAALGFFVAVLVAFCFRQEDATEPDTALVPEPEVP